MKTLVATTLLLAIVMASAAVPADGKEKPAPGPRDVDPYLGVYEGVYESGGKAVKAEVQVTTIGANSPYQAVVYVDPDAVGCPRFVVSSARAFDALDVYTSQDGKTKGINFAYYAGDSSKMDFDARKPAKTGTLPGFSLDPKETEDFYGFKFTGFVKIPSSGRYRFFLVSDDGSRLAIDGKVIVDSPGYKETSTAVALETGMHPLALSYFQNQGQADLKVGVLKISEEEDKRIVLKGAGLDTVWQGRLLPEKLVLSAEDPAKGRFVLEYKNRQSPTLGLEPPKGAIVLLGKGDGGPPSLDEWTNKTWVALPDGSMQVGTKDTRSIKEFGDQRIHVEFMCPFEPEKLGQGRGNSGVYVQGSYELQVLDSFGFEIGRSTCGAVYYLEPALRPACLPPLTWQTYDAVFRAPRFNAAGAVEKNPVFELVEHNGRVVHKNLEVPKGTYGGMGKNHKKVGPLWLQDHGNPVRYRNIWIEPR